MNKFNKDIPQLLNESLDEDFNPENILGYRYALGFWKDDEAFGELSVPVFIEEPYVQVYLSDNEKERVVTFKGKGTSFDADIAFNSLLQWLTNKFGKLNGWKEELYGVVKDEGKYKVEFGLSKSYVHTRPTYDVETLREDVESLIPNGFVLENPDGVFEWRWKQKNLSNQVTICFQVGLRYVDNQYHTNQVSIWYDVDRSEGVSHGQEKELDTVCRNIAMMIANKYKNYKDLYVFVMARYVHFSTMKEIGRVMFDVNLEEKEMELLKCLLFTSEHFYPENLRWQDSDLFHRIEKKAENKLAKAFGPQPPLVHIGMHWADGERQRLIAECRNLTKEDIDEKLFLLESHGNTAPSREELLAGIGDCFIWKEVWKRETGHMWEDYSLLKRTPSEEELNYADCSQFAVRLRDLSTEKIITLIKESKE